MAEGWSREASWWRKHFGEWWLGEGKSIYPKGHVAEHKGELATICWGGREPSGRCPPPPPRRLESSLPLGCVILGKSPNLRQPPFS